MDQDLLEAWSLGLAAGYARSAEGDNPFLNGTDRAHCWSQGWDLGVQCGAERERRLIPSEEQVIPATAIPSPWHTKV